MPRRARNFTRPLRISSHLRACERPARSHGDRPGAGRFGGLVPGGVQSYDARASGDARGGRLHEAESRPSGQTDTLAARLQALERRVAALEQRATGSTPAHDAADATPHEPSDERTAPGGALPGALVTALAGRLLVVLGGAYVLRALTEGDVVSRQMGIALGLAYGALWLPVGLRAAQRSQPLAAAFHAAACCLITYPLIWETTTRFGTLDPAVGAAATVLLFAGGIGVAVRAGLPSIAWLSVLGASGCALALAYRSTAFAPAALAAMTVGMLALLPARRRGFAGPSWVGATAAGAGGLRVLFEGVQQDPTDITPLIAIGLLLWLFAGYLAITVTRTLLRRRPLSILEAVQTAGALLVGHGGAMLISRMRDAASATLGVATLGAAALIYVAAFALLDRTRRRTFVYLTTLSFVLVVGGCAVLLANPEVPWTLLALATAVLGRRFGRLILSHQGSFYATAAAFASNLVATSGAGWTGSAHGTWAPIPSTGWAALAALLVCAVLPARRSAAYRAALSFLPQLVVVAVAAWCLGGIVVLGTRPLLPAGDAGLLATLRMAVLITASLGLLVLSRQPRFASCRFLLGPMLAAGAVKLLAEDLLVGRPLTLAFSFALYGVLLMAGPRLRGPAEPAAGAAAP